MTDILHTRLCDLLGCRYPIIQAGMGGVARSELAAAVSAAGGFGCLGMVREPPDLIAREIDAVRKRTDRPFAVNLIPCATKPDLFDAEMTVCENMGVGAVVFFWDVDPDAIGRAKSAGMTVIYQVGSAADAIAAVDAGADAIVAQGVEAGGHVRGEVTSLVLLPLVAAAVDVPVAGCGGFATGSGLAAALALGADGIHCGTAFLATRESFAHDIHKQVVLDADAENTVHTDAYIINWPKGSPVRVIANEMTGGLGHDLFGHDPDRIDRVQIAEEDGRPIYLWSTDSPLRSMTGDLNRLAMFAGQSAGLVDDLPSAAERIERIVGDARSAIAAMTTPDR